MNSIMADEGHDIRPPRARRPRVRRAPVGRNTFVRFILTDETDLDEHNFSRGASGFRCAFG